MAESVRKGSDLADNMEHLCRRCGLCCHEKIRFGDQVVITDVPCRFLDTTTARCTVYPERFQRQARCSSAADSVLANSLPGSCPYVGGHSQYLDPHLLCEHPEYEQAVDALLPGRKEGKLPRSRILAARHRGRRS